MAKLVIQDSWLAYNPFYGCNANCVYCFQKPRNKTAISVKSDYLDAESEYNQVISYYKSYYYKNDKKIVRFNVPIAIGTETDMLQKEQLAFLLHFLEIHRKSESIIPIVIISKQCIPDEVIDVCRGAVFRLYIFMSASLLPDGFEKGNPSLEARLNSASRIRKRIVDEHISNIKLIHNWRPFITCNELGEKRNFIERISKIFDCSILIGLRITNAMYKQIITDPYNPFYELVEEKLKADEHFFDSDAEEILDYSLQDVFDKIAPFYPCFRNSSCALSYLENTYDYTGTMWREDICPETICPQECVKRCERFKSEWAQDKLRFIECEYLDRADCIELQKQIEYERTIAYTHIVEKPVYVPAQYQKMEWYCGNYRYYNKKYHSNILHKIEQEDEILDLVDQDDKVIGREGREKIYKLGLHNYRVINAFIENKKGEILLTLRDKKRSIFPAKYDFSVGGHVMSGESYEEALIRECEEELGITVNMSQIQEIGYFMYPNDLKTSSFSKLFVITGFDGEVRCGDGVQIAKYETKDNIFRMIEELPDSFKSDYKALFEFYIRWRENG